MSQQQTTETIGQWNELAQDRPRETIARGQTLYTPEHEANDLFLLTHGQVALSLVESERRSLTLRVVEPGQIFGHVAATGDSHYDSVAEAQVASRVVRISRAELAPQIERDSSLALALLESLGDYRLEVSRRLDEVAFMSVPARLASVLLNMAPHQDDTLPARVPRHSHRQLAEMVNAYRETVTKVINQFVAARLLEIDRYTITLVNRPRLEELAQGW